MNIYMFSHTVASEITVSAVDSLLVEFKICQ